MLTLICYLFTGQIVSVFLTGAAAYDYGVSFAHILLCSSFLFGIFYVLINALQARGAATESLIVSRKRTSSRTETLVGSGAPPESVSCNEGVLISCAACARLGSSRIVARRASIGSIRKSLPKGRAFVFMRHGVLRS